MSNGTTAVDPINHTYEYSLFLLSKQSLDQGEKKGATVPRRLGSSGPALQISMLKLRRHTVFPSGHASSLLCPVSNIIACFYYIKLYLSHL
jgi:hypothetical protein